MKHVVLGNGNLAQSLIQELRNRGENYTKFSRSDILEYRGYKHKFNYPHDTPSAKLFGIKDPNNCIVWNAIGAGSIPEADENFQPSMIAHLGLAADLDQTLPKGTTIINFSTDYAAEPSLSRYAFSKTIMEHYINNFAGPKVFCIRVANLYGTHRPENTLPYKLLKNSDKIKSLPGNLITPTPTEWLAKKLLTIDWEKHEEMCINLPTMYGVNRTYPLGPKKSMSVKDFGEMVLNKKLDLGEADYKRPSVELGNFGAFEETVAECWENSDFKKKFT